MALFYYINLIIAFLDICPYIYLYYDEYFNKKNEDYKIECMDCILES
jgi:hypothetical protein